MIYLITILAIATCVSCVVAFAWLKAKQSRKSRAAIECLNALRI